MKKLIGALFSIALALAVALPAAAATQGGKLVYARYADSLLLDPVFNDANVDIWITTNLYDTLFLPTDDGKDVQPGLATAWQAADDGLSYTITLRQGVKFADGTLTLNVDDKEKEYKIPSDVKIKFKTKDGEEKEVPASESLDRMNKGKFKPTVVLTVDGDKVTGVKYEFKGKGKKEEKKDKDK